MAIDYEATLDGKAQMTAKKRNALVIANLIMAFTGEATMRLIWKAISNYWPGGLAHLVVEASFQNTTTRHHYKNQVAARTDVE